MKKQLAVLVFAGISASFVLADEYQVQVSGSLVQTNSNTFSDATFIGAEVQYHFNPVNTNKGPLAEAAFLNQSSNVSVEQGFSDTDDYVSNVTVVSGELYIPDSIFYLRGSYTDFSNDDRSSSSWALAAGITPLDGLLVTTTYVKDVDYEPNLSAKYVVSLNEGNALALGGQFRLDDDGGDVYSAGADYYFNPKTSIGFAVSDTEIDTVTTLRANHFFRSNAYVGVSWTNTDDSDAVGISAGFRF